MLPNVRADRVVTTAIIDYVKSITVYIIETWYINYASSSTLPVMSLSFGLASSNIVQYVDVDGMVQRTSY